MAVGTDVFWSGDRESVSVVWDNLKTAGQMTLKSWLDEKSGRLCVVARTWKGLCSAMDACPSWTLTSNDLKSSGCLSTASLSRARRQTQSSTLHIHGLLMMMP
ncbi:jg14722 [Pararge aegeria aegeria]|uniref:Jg14722 protein n=1 Tax=Pararge aegeria aegeria TaxID=348720 RepID=A0A8S4SJ81_9NEOP|nr:jg14722 [Pararge aegeria aegeria]